jgi:hypothetical protein
MGAVNHIGHWPWRDETGTGPLATDGEFGFGRGLIISDTAVPYIDATFPLAYPTKAQAMWHFWRVRSWELTLVTVHGYLDATKSLLIQDIGSEEDLVTAHNGINYRIRQVLDDIHYEADIYVGAPLFIPDIQGYYNPITGMWLPKIRIQINFFKTELPEDEVLVGTFGSPFPYTCTLNGETVNLLGSGDVVSITFVPDEYWSYGGAYNTSTGAPL